MFTLFSALLFEVAYFFLVQLKIGSFLGSLPLPYVRVVRSIFMTVGNHPAVDMTHGYAMGTIHRSRSHSCKKKLSCSLKIVFNSFFLFRVPFLCIFISFLCMFQFYGQVLTLDIILFS